MTDDAPVMIDARRLIERLADELKQAERRLKTIGSEPADLPARARQKGLVTGLATAEALLWKEIDRHRGEALLGVMAKEGGDG